MNLARHKETKDPSRDDIPVGLLRQRRNLILISILLQFSYYSGVEVTADKIVHF